MQTVIIIEEENHGIIGIAKDYKNALYFLIGNNWIGAESNVFYNKCYTSLESVLGKNWQDKFLALEFNEFCELFDGEIYLQKEKIFEKAT